MGMFDWLKRKAELDDAMLEPVEPWRMPEPTRPAPPMPIIKPAKLNISEPVITLLKMLENDEWECYQKCDYSPFSSRYSMSLINVWDENIELLYKWSVSSYSNSSEISPVLNLEWVSSEERKLLVIAIKKRYEDSQKLQSDHDHMIRDILHRQQRAAFAKQLGVAL